jgi:hypothetical protein
VVRRNLARNLIAALGLLASDFFLIPPLYALGLSSRAEGLGGILYLVTCVPIIAIGEANHRSADRCRLTQDLLVQSNADLETRVQQRTAELETPTKVCANSLAA